MGRKGRKGKDAAAGGGGMREATLVRVSKLLEDFRASDAEVYTFEPDISKHERAAIHEMCRKMGMISKSSGYGERRRLSVYKSKQKQGADMEEGPSHLGFSEEARHVLQDLFTHYPPDDANLNGDADRNSGDKAANIKWKTDSAFCRPTMSKPDITKKIEILSSKINGSAQLRKIMEDRSKLPISSFKDAITSTLENHQVVLISGETGCGKTTQGGLVMGFQEVGPDCSATWPFLPFRCLVEPSFQIHATGATQGLQFPVYLSCLRALETWKRVCF